MVTACVEICVGPSGPAMPVEAGGRELDLRLRRLAGMSFVTQMFQGFAEL
jgi:hypothetical protein